MCKKERSKTKKNKEYHSLLLSFSHAPAQYTYAVLHFTLLSSLFTFRNKARHKLYVTAQQRNHFFAKKIELQET